MSSAYERKLWKPTSSPPPLYPGLPVSYNISSDFILAEVSINKKEFKKLSVELIYKKERGALCLSPFFLEKKAMWNRIQFLCGFLRLVFLDLAALCVCFPFVSLIFRLSYPQG